MCAMILTMGWDEQTFGDTELIKVRFNIIKPKLQHVTSMVFLVLNVFNSLLKFRQKN